MNTIGAETMMDELLANEVANDAYTIYISKRHPYDDYAINPFQLERIVNEGKYKVHINYYGEKTFGPPVKRKK